MLLIDRVLLINCVILDNVRVGAVDQTGLAAGEQGQQGNQTETHAFHHPLQGVNG
jgi:hypothetical protein